MRLPWQKRDNADPTGSAAQAKRPVPVSAEEARRLLQQDRRMLVIDVRTSREYARGHIPGARSIPLAELSRRLDEVARDRTVLTVCLSGHRSATAGAVLLQAGFADVRHLAGGMMHWGGSLEHSNPI